MSVSVLDQLLQHTGALRALARDLVGEAHADDVVQDAAVAALTAPPAEPGAAGGWLATVVRRLAGKRRRDERVRAGHEQRAARREAAPAERSAEDADTLRRLTAIVVALPEPYRGTLLARYLRECSPREIAAETGVPVRTVKTRLQRGLRLLRDELRERDADWRQLLAAAFGLERAGASLGSATILMGTTAKLLFGGAALLLVTIGIVSFAHDAPPPAAVAVRSASQPAADAAHEGAAAAADERTALATPVPEKAPPAEAAGAKAGADAVVVHAVDADSGTAVESFALRCVADPGPLLNVDHSLRHAGAHADGRLAVPEAELAQRVFQLEDGDHRYLPSKWFSLTDAVARDGERVIELRLPRPVDIELTVVRDGGAPVAGTKVEVVRRWPSSPEITVRSTVQPSERLRVQMPENPIAMGWIGGLALLLADGTTDAAGHVHLRAPSGEPLALRLLGPGHTPVVRAWSLESATQPVQRVEMVASGASIRGRVLPLDLLHRLCPPLPAPGPGLAPQTVARYATGLRLRHRVGETIPPGNMIDIAPKPLAADGTFAIDGLMPGDWQVFFHYSLRVQEVAPDPRWSSDGANALVRMCPIEIELPALTGIGEGELRMFDVDVSALQPGRVELTLTRDGQPPDAGALLIQPIAECGAPLPILRSTPNLRPDKDGHISALLPPARFATRWQVDKKPPAGLPLADLEVRSGAIARVDFAIDPLSAQFRVVEADGSTAARGMLQVTRAEPAIRIDEQGTGAEGIAAFDELPRGMPLRLSFRRPQPAGAPASQPIDLGPWTANAPLASPQLLRLPAR